MSETPVLGSQEVVLTPEWVELWSLTGNVLEEAGMSLQEFVGQTYDYGCGEESLGQEGYLASIYQALSMLGYDDKQTTVYLKHRSILE